MERSGNKANTAPFIGISAALVLLTACATQEIILKQTPSGHAEGTFAGASPDQVKSRIQFGCARRGWAVYASSLSQVVCGYELQGSREEWGARLVIGNLDGAKLVHKRKFVIDTNPSGSNTLVYEWLEAQPELGTPRQVEVLRNSHRNAAQQFLWSLGAN